MAGACANAFLPRAGTVSTDPNSASTCRRPNIIRSVVLLDSYDYTVGGARLDATRQKLNGRGLTLLRQAAAAILVISSTLCTS
jgi:hypothetical protein